MLEYCFFSDYLCECQELKQGRSLLEKPQQYEVMTRNGKCSAKCGHGNRTIEFRICQHTLSKGLDCSKNITKTQYLSCKQDLECPKEIKYGNWSDKCDKDCRKGVNDRSIQRRCPNFTPPDSSVPCQNNEKAGKNKARKNKLHLS